MLDQIKKTHTTLDQNLVISNQSPYFRWKGQSLTLGKFLLRKLTHIGKVILTMWVIKLAWERATILVFTLQWYITQTFTWRILVDPFQFWYGAHHLRLTICPRQHYIITFSLRIFNYFRFKSGFYLLLFIAFSLLRIHLHLHRNAYKKLLS